MVSLQSSRTVIKISSEEIKTSFVWMKEKLEVAKLMPQKIY